MADTDNDFDDVQHNESDDTDGKKLMIIRNGDYVGDRKVMVFFIWDKMAIMLYRQTHFTFANFVLFPLCIC